MGLKDPNKPIGSFIFLGPTGVGKTQLAKELAKQLFGDADALIRVDMSEYMEKFNSTKLIGAPPGYVGHEDGGQLTEKVRRKPYSIVLFDEIEKAHPDIFNSLLQILDEGLITDGLGRKINFKNTLIILTSNVGQRKLNEFGSSIGFSKDKAEKAKIEGEILLKKELEKTFSPEFLNRLDEIIYFDPLAKENIIKILDVELDRMKPRFETIGIKIKITDTLKEKIAEVGYDPKFGARPLKRVLQKYVEDTVAETMINNKINPGDTFTLDFDPKKEGTTSTPVKVKITAKKQKPTE
jgi:ATP-dependent Clp protease ATP-binding subunit ClpC